LSEEGSVYALEECMLRATRNIQRLLNEAYGPAWEWVQRVLEQAGNWYIFNEVLPRVDPP